MRGGYKLINLFDKSLSNTPIKIDGIYQKIINSNQKTFLFSNVLIGENNMNDVFSSYYLDDNNDYRFKCFDGYIKVTDGDMVSFHKESSGGGEPYTLPTATATRLGGIKVGQNLTVESDGTLNASGGGTPYELPTASANTLGGVKVGNNLSIDANGVLSATGGGTPYELPTASANTLGGIKVGNNLSIDSNGVLSAQTSANLHYTTSEQVVGSWIDNKPLYQKTIDIGYLPDNTIKNVAHNISNIKEVIDIRGGAAKLSNNIFEDFLPIPYADPAALISAVSIGVDTTNVAVTTKANYWTGYYGYATVLYTKTTD